jgi:hypothetical protein
MENNEQEKMSLPFSSFTTLRGKKGYPAEEVEEYFRVVKDEYTQLEAEYRKMDSENTDLAVQLGQEQEERRSGESKVGDEKKRYDELNERYEALLAESAESGGLSALEREEYQQCKESLERQGVELLEKEREIERLRTANEDFGDEITAWKAKEGNRQDYSALLDDAQRRELKLEEERDALAAQLEAKQEQVGELGTRNDWLEVQNGELLSRYTQAEKEQKRLQDELTALQEKKEQLEGGNRIMNETLTGGQETLQAEIRSLKQQLAEKDAEVERLKAERTKIPVVAGEVIDGSSLSIQQGGVPVGYASKYVDIFEIVRSAADRYAFETEETMNRLLSESEETARQKITDANIKSKEMVADARTEADELLEESRVDAEKTKREGDAALEAARQAAKEIVQNAEQRAASAIAKANDELKGIRTLIGQHSQKYLELSAEKASEPELL